MSIGRTFRIISAGAIIAGSAYYLGTKTPNLTETAAQEDIGRLVDQSKSLSPEQKLRLYGYMDSVTKLSKNADKNTKLLNRICITHEINKVFQKNIDENNLKLAERFPYAPAFYLSLNQVKRIYKVGKEFGADSVNKIADTLVQTSFNFGRQAGMIESHKVAVTSSLSYVAVKPVEAQPNFLGELRKFLRVKH